MASKDIHFTKWVGETEMKITAPVVDGIVEVSEEFFIILMNESGWELSDEQGTNS